MKIGGKITAGFALTSLIVVLVGLFGLSASRRIVRQFDGGDMRFKSIVTAANEASSYAKRAEGCLMLFLTIHDDSEREKFFKNYISLKEQIKILEAIVMTPEERQILQKIKSDATGFLSLGNSIIATHDAEMMLVGKIDYSLHKDTILAFHEKASGIRKNGLLLARLATNFLNKQEVITAAIEVNSYAKRAAGHLMLYLTLNDEVDRKKFFQRVGSMRNYIHILEKRATHPEVMAVVKEMEGEAEELHEAGKSLLKVYDKEIVLPGGFQPERHKELLVKLNYTSAILRQQGVKLASFLAELEYRKYDEAVDEALVIQRSILIVMGVAFAIALVLGHMISRTISRPLARLKQAAMEIGRGRYDAAIDVGTADEISELAASFREMAKNLKKTTVSRDYLDSIINSTQESIIVVSASGDIEKINRSACELLGYDRKELIGKPVDTISVDLLSLFSRVKDFKEKSLISEVHATCFTREEQKTQINCSASPVMNSDGKVVAVIFVTHNSNPRPSEEISSH